MSQIGLVKKRPISFTVRVVVGEALKKNYFSATTQK